MTAPVTAVRLRLPSGWLELDPREPDLVTELHRAIRRLWGENVDDARALSLLGPLALRLRTLANTADVLLVGLYADVVPAPPGDLPLIITAHAMLALSPELDELASVRKEIEAGARNDDLELDVVDLPAGRAVRVSGDITISDPAWDGEVPARLRRYFVPVPGQSRIALLSFLTPNLELRDAFDEVFDAIAESLGFD